MSAQMKKLLALAATLALVNCGDSTSPTDVGTGNDGNPATETGNEARSTKLRDESPDVTAAALADVASANREFAFELYGYLRGEEEGNFFYSPHSISAALAMTFAGARNDTELEMADAMSFTLVQDELHPAFNALDLALTSRGHGAEGRDGDGFRLNIANALWSQQGMHVEADFLDVLAESYDAGLRLVDFGKADEACAAINGWVSDETEGKIPKLLEPSAVAGALMVLTNAIYFNAQWEHVFDAEYTKDEAFHRLDGGDVDVPMMRQSETFVSTTGEGYRAASLPYDGGELDMVVLVPDAGRFAEIEGALDGAFIGNVIAGLEAGTERSSVVLPKWDVRSEFGLAEALKALGMPVAFGPTADFSGITGGKDLWIDEVIHKTMVSVDEYGTEAAAATAVMMSGGIPTLLSVDRPFVFFIRDIETGAVLFVGRVLDPTL